MVTVGDISAGSHDRFQEVGCHHGWAVHRICDREPGNVPSDLGLNIDGAPTGFLTRSNRHSVNMEARPLYWLLTRVLGGIGIVTPREA